MIQHPFNGNNNGGAEFIPRQSGSNSQFDNSYKKNNSITQMSMSMTSAGQQSNRSCIPVSRGATHIYYKTRMCQQFVEGRCPKAADCCNYSHGHNDLREPVLNWQENANNKGGRNGSGNWNEDHKRTPQRGICWKFFHGEECPYGENCGYSHDATQLNAGTVMDPRQIRESSVIDIKTVFDHGQSQTKATTVQVSSHPDVLQTSVKNNYWKTRICSKWETTGHCVFGDKCNYAHGLAELNTPVGLIEGDGSVAANGVHIPITEPLVTHSTGAAPVHIGSELLNLAKRKGDIKRLSESGSSTILKEFVVCFSITVQGEFDRFAKSSTPKKMLL
ncbi:zinc finger, CCCH-type [Artemisia annua]|uniref:Zinc finger, CCCH-type n=1 Tax=Artemisia annua TaxID=35608 RepID=A0A2U1KW82_ARTAN|nr:zinc finger, CCCH-type [Artemisia annua]